MSIDTPLQPAHASDAERNAAARRAFDPIEDAGVMHVAMEIAREVEPVWRVARRTGPMRVEATGRDFDEDAQARAAWLANDSLVVQRSRKVHGREVLVFANPRLALVHLRARQREQAFAALDKLGDGKTLSLALGIARGEEPVGRLLTEQHMAHSTPDGDWEVFGPEQRGLAELLAGSTLNERPSQRYGAMVVLQFADPAHALESLQACLQRYARAPMSHGSDDDEWLLSVGLAMAQKMEPVLRESPELLPTCWRVDADVEFREADVERLAWLAGEPIVEQPSVREPQATALGFRDPRAALAILTARVRAIPSVGDDAEQGRDA